MNYREKAIGITSSQIRDGSGQFFTPRVGFLDFVRVGFGFFFGFTSGPSFCKNHTYLSLIGGLYL